MAWNEPGSGNNGDKDKKDPWSGQPKPGGPPDLEQTLRNLYKKAVQLVKTTAQTGGGSKMPPIKIKVGRAGVALAVSIIIAMWFFWGLFIVGAAEQGIVLRFGKYVDTAKPGPHWIPRLIEDVYIVNTQNILTYPYATEMLTKDENIVSVAVTVQYRIANAHDYLFNVVNPNATLQQATASTLRQVIGNTSLDDVLAAGHGQISAAVQNQLTNTLNKYQTGLVITDVTLQPAKAPEEVKDAFDDVAKAQEDAQRFENQARAYAMQVQPEAQGQAQTVLAEAKAYQQQVVLHAQADTAQFLAILPQYQSAPAVTRERLYIDTLESVLSNSNKVLIDSSGTNNIFYLPLDKLTPINAKIATPVVATTAPTPAAPTTATTTATTAPTNNPDEGNARMQGGY